MPEDIEAFKEQKEELSLPSWSSGLLGFEVLLLDLNQHGAEQGLYWLLWPTSVGHGLPLTCLSLTPKNITFCLGHSTTTELLHNSKYNNSCSFLLKRGILCLSSFSASTKDGIKEEDERWVPQIIQHFKTWYDQDFHNRLNFLFSMI